MNHGRTHRDRITDEAAEWFARAQDPEFSAADRQALADWLAGSAEHVREYLQLAALSADIRGLSSSPSIGELLELARQSGDGANVVPLSGAGAGETWARVPASRAGELDQQGSSGELQQHGGHRSRTRQRKGGRGLLYAARSPRRLWTAAASVLVFAAAAALYVQNLGPDVYATALGEQRSVRLEDGSVITLNAQSTIEVAYTDERRDVRLLSGEVLFDVDKDPSRPFQVLAQGTVIRAIGTAFNVRHRGEDTTVTVVEGTVQVEAAARRVGSSAGQAGLQNSSGEVAELPRSGEPMAEPADAAPAPSLLQPVRLTVGQQARVDSRSGQVAVIETNTAKVTAWRQRRLVFDAWPLSKVVAEFNLYNERPIVIGSAALAQRAISGAFDADDRASFALFLEEAGIAEADIRSDGTIELQQKAALP